MSLSVSLSSRSCTCPNRASILYGDAKRKGKGRFHRPSLRRGAGSVPAASCAGDSAAETLFRQTHAYASAFLGVWRTLKGGFMVCQARAQRFTKGDTAEALRRGFGSAYERPSEGR